MIYNSVHDMFIRRAIELVKQAKKKSNAPFGALLVNNGVVLMEAENTVMTDRDPTRHAELSLVSAACRTLSTEDIVSCTLYTSTEPCAMCAGAVYWAGITRVVFGFPESGLQKLVSPEDRDGNLGVDSRAILCPHGVEVIGPVLEDEARAVHEQFWDETVTHGVST